MNTTARLAVAANQRACKGPDVEAPIVEMSLWRSPQQRRAARLNPGETMTKYCAVFAQGRRLARKDTTFNREPGVAATNGRAVGPAAPTGTEWRTNTE